MTETEIERLVVRLTGDSSSYQKMMKDSAKAVDQTTATVQAHTASLTSFQGRISGIMALTTRWGAMLGGLVGVGSVLGGLGFGIKLASDAEQANVAFSSLLKSEEKAKALLLDLQKFAAATPFEFPELKIAAKSLLSAGFAARDIIPMMRTLGDVTSAMGTGQEGIQRATYALMQMKQAGRILGGDLMQLNNAGVPAMKILAASMGKTTEQVMEMARGGHLGSDAMNKFFDAIKSGKGLEMYLGGMEKQSKTLFGLFSTLKDNVGIALTQIGQTITDALNLKGLVEGASNFIQKYTDTVVGGFKTVVAYVVPLAKRMWENFNIGLNYAIQLWNFLRPLAIQVMSAIRSEIMMFYRLQVLIFDRLKDGWTIFTDWIGSVTGITFKQIRDYIVEIYIVAEFTFDNIERIAVYAWNLVALSAVQYFETFKHFFMVEVPTILNWVSNNWHDIWFSMFDFTSTGFINLVTNIKSAMNAIWEYIKLGGDQDVSFVWKPLTEGFVNAIKKLPEIPERVIGELEKSLIKSTGKMGEELGDAFNSFRQKRLKDLFGEPLQEATKAIEKAKGIGDDIGSTLGKSMSDGLKHSGPFDAAIVGSKEAFQHIQEYRQGLGLLDRSGASSISSSNPQIQNNQLTAQTNTILGTVISKMDEFIGVSNDIRDKPAVTFTTANLPVV